MKTFEVGQEVVLLDGTSLVGVVVDKAYQNVGGELEPTYKVVLEGSTGRWYNADEVAVLPTDAPAVDGVSDAYRLEGLSAQIVHAQMVLQDALGYEEVDYNISLTDLAEDIEDLRSALQFVKNQLALIPAPITDTRFATETINSVWATVADALDGRQATE